MNSTTLRGLSVLRLSVMSDETTSPERQRAANQGAASALGIDLGDREAVDLGVSASKTTPFQRPELGTWLQRPDDFDALVAWRFDRLVRRMDDMHEISKWARDHKKMIVFAEGPGGRLVLDFRNPLDPVAQLMVSVFAFAAQMEAQSIRERVTGAQAALRSMPLRWRGSRPPYGYTPAELDGGGWTLVQDSETVPVIERIIKELREGHTATAIAAGLNRDGIPSPRDYWSLRQGRETGGKTGGRAGQTVTSSRFSWRHGSVKTLITSERLLGWKMHGTNPVRDSEGRPVMATAEPILTRQELDTVRALLEARSIDNKNRPYRADSAALLLRVIICGGCKGLMYLHRPNSERATTFTETYRCAARTRGQVCPEPASIKREWADEYTEREVLRLLGSMGHFREEIIPGYDPQPEIAATLAEYEAHQEERGRQRSEAAKAAWQRRADALDARLSELEQREKIEPRTVRVPTETTFRDDWHAADSVEGKRAILEDVGARLTVRKAKRGRTRQLDESRVSLDFTIEFFSTVASDVIGMIEEAEREAAGIDW